ncbi:hypothetical protein GIB67_000549 [Kingdonia uniflora]|uniref:Carboxypeptidase n=1 Tax=Kingdonia uniflora TaxID=39325 RepID=A0A7J7MIB1_9MAGN|nr:hypothetical protein GIB67_000549 [Kingdonia uniflora]
MDQMLQPQKMGKNQGYHAGYYKIQHSHAARMFYFFFESRTNKKDPVVIWLSSDNHDLRHNEDRVSNDLYDFLQAFFTEHPQYAKNDFYIMGESYAGHYIPTFAARVHRGNKAKEGIHINLMTYYALEMGIIQQSEYKNVNKMLPACELATKLCGYYSLRLNDGSGFQAPMVQPLAWLPMLFATKCSTKS